MGAADSRFLVLGLTGLVLRDVIGTMKDRFPSLEASTFASVGEAVAQISKTSGWRYAFLNLAPDAFVASELSKLFETLGTKVILLGDAAEDAAAQSPYPVLIRPFMADDIFRLLDIKS